MGNDIIREVDKSMEKVNVSLKPLNLNNIPVKQISIEGKMGTDKIRVKGKLI
jgi:hypothetical protein